jgi:hypothetical protein
LIEIRLNKEDRREFEEARGGKIQIGVDNRERRI